MIPRSGDVLHITREASVQFIEPIVFRVIRLHQWPTYDRWLWLDGYELNSVGDAVSRRSIFVQRAGLLRAAPVQPHPQPRRRAVPVRNDRPTAPTRPDPDMPVVRLPDPRRDIGRLT